MKRELLIKKCMSCGSTVKVLEDCKYVPGATVYAYCNQHGLWKVDVDRKMNMETKRTRQIA